MCEAIVIAATEGYVGIESATPTEDIGAISDLLAEHGLRWICLMGAQVGWLRAKGCLFLSACGAL